MRTKFSNNSFISLVSYKSLNHGALRAVLVMLLFALSVGNAWAGDSYYAQVTASANPTGAGSVYVSYNSNTKGSSNTAKGADQQNTLQNFYLYAVTGYGYSWGNWTAGTVPSGGSQEFTQTTTKEGALFKARTKNSDGTLSYTVTANFNRRAIEAAGVSGSDMAVQTWKSHSGTTITLEDKYALKNTDVPLTYSPAAIGGLSPNASWAIGTTDNDHDGAAITNGKWTIVLAYDFANPTALVHNLSQSLTVSEAVAVQSKTVAVPLDLTPVFTIPDGYAFPELAVGSTDTHSFAPSDYGDLPIGNAKLTWTAELTGENADQFHINSTTPTNGEVTVTFAPTAAQSSAAAVVLTATWQDANGANISYSQTYNLHGDTPLDYEARVISSSGEELFTGDFMDAVPVANANENCTLQLVNDVEVTSSIEFTKSITLDLYSKELRRTGIAAASQLILLNTAGKLLTITDSKPGALGTLYAAGNANAQLQAVKVANGSVVMSNCKVYVENTNTNGTEKTLYAIGVYVATGKSFTMTGGTITANRTGGRNGYGVYAEKTSTVELTNVTIDVAAPSYAYGIVSDGSLTITNVHSTATAPTCTYGIYPTANATAVINSGSFTAHSTNGNIARAIINVGNTAIMDGTFTALVDNGTTATAAYATAGILAIKKGTFSATASATTAYGIHLNGGSSRAVVYGGTFTGLANGTTSTTAAGARVEKTSVLEATAGTFSGIVDRSGLTAATNVNSYGLLLVSGGTANVSGATLKAENKQTYSRYAYGVSSAGALSLSNCQIEAKSPYQYNMGISITGSTATIRDCNVNAYSTAGAYNYGIYVNAAAAIANVENTDFTVTSYTTYAYGANVNNGTLNATNCSFDVTANQTTATSAGDANCHAIHVNTGKTANLRGCTIIAKTPKTDYYNSSKGEYVGISQYAYGVYNAGKVEIDECTISATSHYRYAYAIRATTASTYTHVNSGKFKTSVTTSAQVATQAPIYRDETKGKTVVYGGFFDKNTNLDYYVADGYGINPLGSDRTEYSEGYRYVVEATSEQGNYVCKIGNTKYRTLEEALQYANQNIGTTLTILMTANYKLPAGDYVLPPKATLLVPYSASQTAAKKNNLERITTTGSRTPYLVLTFADGVHFSAKGSIEVGGRQYSGGGANTGCVADNYGQIVLEGDARIDVENNASLYAWGYITGTGMVNVKAGSQVYEMFVMGDWKGGAQAYALYSDKKAFLVSHYFYQNIEANVLYRPGAKAYGSGTVYASSSIQDVDDVEMIGPEGSEAMFTMDPATESADTYVKKIYHPNTDRLEFVLNSGANLNALTITAMGYEFPASKYILPICSNITITLAEGDIRVNQNFYFMPGSILNIQKEATFIIPSGKSIYFYDGDENDFSHIYTSNYGLSNASNTSTIYRIGYTPSFVTNPRSTSAWPDAELFVHGKIEVSGNLYTTTHGANIHSTNADAGKITFYSAVPSSTTATINQHIGGKGSGFSGQSFYTAHSLTPAQLKNDVSYEGTDDEYSATAGTQAKETWVYVEGKWTKLSEEGCFNTRTAGSTKQYYIHAGDAVEVDYPARADHAYKATSAERYFINAEDCMWWEAELQTIGGVEYYVANQEKYDNYGTCYYYDATAGYWKPKYVTVAWNIQTLSGAKTITYTDVPLNTRPKYNSENPAKPGDGTADFVWIGWENEAGNTYSKTDVLPIATGDVTYTAVFERRPYIYTVAFLNPDGSPISGKKYEAGQIPVAPEAPTQTPTAAIEYEFTGWDKPIVAVTGPTEYTAVYVSHPRKYNVTFYDLDGKTVLQTSKVEYNTMPSYSGAIPNHSDKYYTYVFDGWSPEIVKVTGDANYTARYNTTKNKYTVTFQNPDGSVVDQQLLEAGSTPVAPSNPTMEAVDKIYTFTGWDKAISEVTEDVTYTASYTSATRTYTIRFINWNNVELKKDAVAYGSTPTPPADPSKPSDAENDYMFSGWTPNVTSVSGDATYRATFSETKKKYTIVFQNPKGTTLSNPASVDNKWEYGSTPEYTGITPTKSTDALYSYEFKEWTPTITAVTGDKTYIADFTATIRKFTVTWDANGGWCGTASTNVRGGDAVGGLPVTTWEGYEFEGWFTEAIGGSQISAETVITADITYHAHWTLLTYDFTIAVTPAGYGTVSAASVAEVPYGTAVTENGNKITVNGTTITATPAAATAQYTYEFSQWDNVPATVTGNVSIEAVFTRTVNQYTVLWKSEDGASTLETDDNQNYGAVTAFNGTTPTKDANAQYTYAFDGWATEATGEKVYENGATPTVSGAATYYAHFAQTTNAYTVTWKNADGTTLETDENVPYGTTPTYDGATPTKTSTATDVYTFAGWDSEIAAVTGNITYTATYTSVAPVASVTVSGATTYYATLQAAFDYAANKTTPTIKVLADIALAAKVTYTNTSKTTVTIDLNGHTVSGALNPLLTLTSASSTGGLIVIKSSVEGGQIRNVVSSNAARACVVLSKGKLRFESGKIYMENKSTSSSVQAYGIQVGSSRTFTMIGGTVEVKSTKHAYAIYSAGTTNIEGGELIVTETKNGYAAGVHVVNGTATISENPTITVSGTKYVNGVRVGGSTPAINSGKTAVTMYNGVANIEGGTYTVTASTNTAYGVYCYGNTFKVDYTTNATLAGNYANGGTANVRGGVFEVTSGGATAYGVCLQTPATIQTALDADGNATYDAATTHPKANITGGKFNVSGTSESGAVNTAAANTDLIVEGGWYNDATNLDDYTAPTKDCNYYVLDLPSSELPYKYEVAEAYTVTFKNGETTMQEGPVKKGTIPTYNGATPTKDADADGVYTFNTWTPALSAVTADATYTATYSTEPTVASVTINGTTTYYANIDAAFTAANSSVTYDPTITLLRDASTATTTFISYTGARNCTLNLNGHTLSSTTAQALLYINMEGITFTITDLTESKLGTLHLESTSTSDRWCVYVAKGNLQMDAGTVFLRSKANQFNEAVRIDLAASTFTMNGGKVHVVTSDSKPACGIVSKGIAVINGGAVQVEASGIGYGIEARVKDTNIGNITVKGGKFLVTGTTAACAYKSAANATLKLQGGYYNTNTNLEANCATPYHVLPLTGEDPYEYEVAEAYTLTWHLDGGTVTTAGTEAPENATGSPSGVVKKGESLIVPEVTKTGSTFAGWNDGSSVVTPATTMPAANTTYTATWESAETGFWLDIIDVDNTNHKLVVNANNSVDWPAASWPFSINDVTYYSGTADGTPSRDAKNRLEINYGSLDPGAEFSITVKNTGNEIVSKHTYIIPQEVTIPVTLSDNAPRSIFVKGTTLTIDGDVETKNIYVGDDAKLVINEGKTLTADTIFLRTTPEGAAELINQGTISASTQLCYTRIIMVKGTYYQFGLPLSCPISNVFLSDNSTLKYTTGWLLRAYSESKRAAQGAEGKNWETLKAAATIEGGKGYEMYSGSNYYREFYFPVNHAALANNKELTVTRTEEGAAGEKHAGWNVLVSPLTYTCNNDAQPEDMAICLMTSSGWEDQTVLEHIAPAQPFAYQAEEAGTISFVSATMPSLAPRRRIAAADESTRIQWIRLDVKDANGEGDETNIYSHPTRYEQYYQTGIDVAKQSLTAARARLYSSHAYGDMAFAGVSDELFEQGVALTVYSPAAQELTFSLRQNEWLNRLQYVWIIDFETGAMIDLLSSDYTAEVTEGTTYGRFYISGRFRTPQIATDIESTSDSSLKGRAQKVLIEEKIYIMVGDKLYDATGKLVKGK